ncbi:MAG: SDR family oxidoreductase [Candidatus Hydrogenedentes bacterium]|nr:SDR family oxidoreductase [Candidatus Hydrogenedentota bacterium]
MVRVALTGGSGHLGANVLRHLVDQDYGVRALVRRDARALKGVNCERVHGSVFDPELLGAAFANAEIVFHLAGIVSITADQEDLVWRTNVEGTRNVVEACIARGVRRIVFFSSIHAFSAFPANEPITEQRALAEGGDLPIYDRSKAAAELEALKGLDRGLEVIIVNPTAAIGPNDFKPSPMGRVLLDLRAGRLPALIQGGFNWVDCRDVSIGAEAAARVGKSGERYLLGGNYASLVEVARIAANITGMPAPRFATPVWLAKLGLPFADVARKITGAPPKFTKESLRAVTHHQTVCHDKAAREFGYAPRPLDQTIKDTYAWFEQFHYA